jgi:integrase
MSITMTTTLPPLFDSFLTERTQEGSATSTIAGYERILRRFHDWLKDTGIDPETVPPLRASEYVNVALREGHGCWQRLTPSTRANHLTTLRAVYDAAIDNELLDGRNPFRRKLRVKMPTTPKQQRFFTAAELRAILAACENEREYLICMCYAFTGLRCEELIRLAWEPVVELDRQGMPVVRSWVDFESRCLRVCGKGEKIRVIPIHPCLWPLLRRAKEQATRANVIHNRSGNYLTREGMESILTRIMVRAGVKEHGTGAHAFRRSFNNNLRQTARGFDAERNLLMGHSLAKSEGINAVYQSYTVPQLAEVVSRLYLDDPILPTRH